MGCSEGLVSHFTGCPLQEQHVPDGLVLCSLGVPTRVAWPHGEKSAHSFSQSPFLQARPLGFLWLQIWMLALLGSKGCALFSRLKGNGKFLMQKVTQLVELPRGSSLIYRVLGQF